MASSWKKTGRWAWGILYFSSFAALLIAFAALFYVFPTDNVLIAGITLVATGALLWKIFRNPFPDDFEVLVQRGIWAVLIFGFVLNFHFRQSKVG